MQSFFTFFSEIFNHVIICGKKLVFISEVLQGFASIFKFQCERCSKIIKFQTSPFHNELNCFEINFRACFGVIVGGNSYQDLKPLSSKQARKLISKQFNSL